MRTAITLAALALVAASASYATDGTYSLGYGPYNTASNSHYTATFGHSAGYGGWGDSYSTLVGTFAGARGSGNTAGVGLGYAALYGAQNCGNCIAIGANAGRGWQGGTGWVQIGDALLYTNGVLNIGDGLITARGEAPWRVVSINGVEFMRIWGANEIMPALQAATIWAGGIDGSNVLLDENGVDTTSLHAGTASVDDVLKVGGGIRLVRFYDGGESASDLMITQDRLRLYAATWAERPTPSEICTIGDGDSVGVLRFEAGGLSVYTNGVKAGTLTFTPANQ